MSGISEIAKKLARFVRPGLPAATVSLPRPDAEVAVIGDIHGRADLLGKLLAKLQVNAPDAMLVFVGDYVDRGPSSREVLEHLRNLARPSVSLMGNHEAMLLEFLDRPLELGGRWLRNGGAATLASYGITLDESADTKGVEHARDEFSACLAGGTEDWLRALPLYWRSGNLLVTHAGPDPKIPVDQQDDQSLLWGHNRFLRDARSDGIWVAHGHWIRDKPEARDGRIAVDTGAFQSDRLTAAVISPQGVVRFLRS